MRMSSSDSGQLVFDAVIFHMRTKSYTFLSSCLKHDLRFSRDVPKVRMLGPSFSPSCLKKEKIPADLIGAK